MLLACGRQRLNHERLKLAQAHPGISRRNKFPQRGAYASLLLLGFHRGHHLQRQQVLKFLRPFRAAAIALCEQGVVVTTSIVTAARAIIVTTTTSGATASAANSIAASTDIGTKH